MWETFEALGAAILRETLGALGVAIYRETYGAIGVAILRETFGAFGTNVDCDLPFTALTEIVDERSKRIAGEKAP